MKIFLILVSLLVFCSSTISGASIHTLIEAELQQAENRAAAFIIINMPLAQLAELNI